MILFLTVSGEGEVDSWEDIAADESKPAPVVDTQPSAVPPQATVTSSEPATTSKDTISEPSTEPASSSPSNQKEVDDLSDTDLTVKSDGTQATGVDNKDNSESQLKLKEQQGDQSSLSTTSVSKGKVITAPQRSDGDKENVNIVFIGHVDAGKSTIGGHVMLVYILFTVHVLFYCLHFVSHGTYPFLRVALVNWRF